MCSEVGRSVRSVLLLKGTDSSLLCETYGVTRTAVESTDFQTFGVTRTVVESTELLELQYEVESTDLQTFGVTRTAVGTLAS